METRILSLQASQDLADNITNQILTAIYGGRYKELESVEDDPDINRDWETINEKALQMIADLKPFCFGNNLHITDPDLTESKMRLAAQVAYNDWKELQDKIKGMGFNQAYKELNGCNLDYDGFDCNYNSIAVSIFKTEEGYCRLGKNCEVWYDQDKCNYFIIEVNY